MEGATLICLKSEYNNKLLRFRYEKIQTYSLLTFAGDNVDDPYAQFEVIPSQSNVDYFHLRCRYNNKFLVRWSPNHYWISASANVVDENENNWTCTLFKRNNIEDDTKKFRIMHVQLGYNAALYDLGAPFDSCLFAGSKEPDKAKSDVFTSINLEPEYVAFKSKDNGKYLGVVFVSDNGDEKPYLQFSYDNSKDPRVAHEMLTTPQGIVCLRSKQTGKFWQRGQQDWILADADDPRGTDNTHPMFRVTPLDDENNNNNNNNNVVALLNMSKTWYCKRFTTIDGTTTLESFLNVATQDVDRYARLEVIKLPKN